MGYLSARSTAQILLSPGYPSDYENNENCVWLISTSDPRKKVQVEIVSLQLGNWNGDDCEDYLQLSDGKDRDSAVPLGTWCDPVQVQVKSQGQFLLVTFVSDAHVTGPGFALKYYHVEEYHSHCNPYATKILPVGENPLFLDLPMYTNRINSDVECDYHLKSTDNDDVILNLDILSFSRILCDEGSVTIYDGPDDRSPVLLKWCYTNQPFTRLSGSSKDLFIRFSIIDTESDWFVFRAKVTRTIKSRPCSLKSMPNLELSSQAPTYLVYPLYHTSVRGGACPLRLWTEKQGQAIRLEVVSPVRICGAAGVTVYDGYTKSAPDLGSLCNSVLMRGASHNMVLNPEDSLRTAPVFLKLMALNATCNGIVQRKKAMYDKQGILPELANSKSDLVHDLNCTYLLESDHASDVVEVSLSGRLVERRVYDCAGDLVTFYDGDSTSAPVLFTWCGALGQATRVVSTGPRMLVILTTDDRESYQGVNMSYYSFPKMGGCPRETQLTANSTVQKLTSPNYPLYYPINSYCVYKLTAPEGQFIKFQVVSSSLENDCSDNVKLYNGHSQQYQKYIGRWCGEEKPRYRSEGSQLLVVFSADHQFNSGGFEAEFFAASEENAFLFPIIIGCLLLAIVIATVIVVVCICVQRRKKMQRP